MHQPNIDFYFYSRGIIYLILLFSCFLPRLFKFLSIVYRPKNLLFFLLIIIVIIFILIFFFFLYFLRGFLCHHENLIITYYLYILQVHFNFIHLRFHFSLILSFFVSYSSQIFYFIIIILFLYFVVTVTIYKEMAIHYYSKFDI